MGEIRVCVDNLGRRRAPVTEKVSLKVPFRIFIFRIGCALLMGSLIGLERQWRHRMAGLRTNALVALGAALFVCLPGLVVPRETDITRIAGQVVTGIGFLGAGVIMRDGINVRGLNTAATLWTAAAVGTLCGIGYPLEALAGTGMILMANVLLRPLAEWIAGRPTAVDEGTKYYLLSVTCKSRQEAKARALILEMVTEHPFTVRSLHSVGTNDPTKTEVKAELGCTQVGDGFLEEIVRRLSLEPSVSAVSWERLTAEQVDT